MKTSWFKSLIIAGAIVLMSGATVNTVFAQRHGGGRGGHGFSRGGGSFRPSTGHAFRGGYIGSRSARIYRPGFGIYRRPFYGYRSYYRPYLGLRINVLPFGYYPFFFGPDQFYYSGGLFYREYDNTYKVVVPPVGAEVPSIPSDAKEVQINGQTYYEYKGVYYSIAEKADGKSVYVVAGKDGVLNTDSNSSDPKDRGVQVGDVVDTLPESSREVFIKGERYYVTDAGVYYEEVVNGGKITYKVIGLDNSGL
ncbi:DUF6515 family protein [Pedobacter sp. KBW06]|uniref:DUF6515 family protein n=1 Tax=Pedobacter sp. KBW06 TaxID=2153359 RepID=UPI001F329115|nr:DUF6515 family protein [Pedobacter sp. KBW06]